MENLVCQKCSKDWQRPLTRGRKPRFCPDCVTTMVISYDTSGEEPHQDFQPTETTSSVVYKFPGPTRWRCSYCDVSMSTPISLDYEPMHTCQKRADKSLPLDLVKKRN